MGLVRRASEGLARRTSRRGLFGRGAEVATGALVGAAVGRLEGSSLAIAGAGTECTGSIPCPCDGCSSAGVCAKPCIFDTLYYASGCWVLTYPVGGPITCCDCDCLGFQGFDRCECHSDYHNDPANCPKK